MEVLHLGVYSKSNTQTLHGTAIYAYTLAPLAPPLAISRQSGLAVPDGSRLG